MILVGYKARLDKEALTDAAAALHEVVKNTPSLQQWPHPEIILQCSRMKISWTQLLKYSFPELFPDDRGPRAGNASCPGKKVLFTVDMWVAASHRVAMYMCQGVVRTQVIGVGVSIKDLMKFPK